MTRHQYLVAVSCFLGALTLVFFLLWLNKSSPCPKACEACKACSTKCEDCKEPQDCTLPDISPCGGDNSSTLTGKLVRSWRGTDLIPYNEKGWSFYTGNDLTNGYVVYKQANVNKNEGNFANSTSEELHIKPVSVPGVSTDSVRLRSDSTWDYGLFVIDLQKIPYGTYIWPAFWLNGLIFGGSPDAWPAAGEIDIIEGGWDVGGSDNNTVSLHTGPGYSQQNLNVNDPTGNCNLCGTADNCSRAQFKTCGVNGQNGNGQFCPFMGCSQKWPKTKGFGEAFQSNGGGIYATQVNCDGTLEFWFIPNNKGQSKNYQKIHQILNDPKGQLTSQILNDLKGDNIEQLKANQKSSAGSSPFKNLQLVIDTTICGDAFGSKGEPKKNRQMCDPTTVFATQNLLQNANWIINSINVYQ